MSLIKTIAINVFILLSLIGFIIITPPIIFNMYLYIRDGSIPLFNYKNIPTRSKGFLDLYDNYPWAKKHFEEFDQIQTEYYDYITWRRKDFSGETINIENGIRKTIDLDRKQNNLSEYWFFGGSTTWGTGVNDELTYPSIFSKQNNLKAINYGESGWIARQSLALLSNMLINSNNNEKLKNINVVFYDGVNEVLARCRTNSTKLSTDRQFQIRETLSNKKNLYKWSYQRTFAQTIDFLKAISNRITGKNLENISIEDLYSCDENSQKAKHIAMSLIQTWEIASQLVENNGGTFTAILQPVAYLGKPKINYLGLTTEHDVEYIKQYTAVYPLIKKYAKQSNLNFSDLTHIFDGCDNCYIDLCHVGPQGQQILVNEISNLLLN